MDLNEMAVFARVAQCGSFTSAARLLGMPKSTVSRRVSELERRLGARLLQRTTRRLSLTDVGQTFYQHCARVVAEAEDAERAVATLQSEPRGLLRITAPINVDFLGPMISDFLRRHPAVRIDLVCADRVVDLVQEGFDVAIRAGRLVDSSLVARNLGWLRRVLVASPSYLDRMGRPKNPAALARHDCVMFGADPRRGVWHLERGRERRELTLQPRLLVNDFGVMMEATLAGLGIAQIPEARCAEAIRAKQLEVVLPGWASPETPIHAVYPSTRHLSTKLKAFLDQAQSHANLPRERRTPK